MTKRVVLVLLLACLLLLGESTWRSFRAETPKTTVFIDTDIGSDVDDALAVLTVLGMKRFAVTGISTVNGDTKRRASIALRLLELAGEKNIPVAAGVGSTLLRQKQPRNWETQLSQFLDQSPKAQLSPVHGVDLMIESVHQHPGLTILAIGPLTNIAVAIIKDPSILPEIGKLVLVGGATTLPPVTEKGSIFVDYKSEYNLNSDPDAARLVFNSGVPIVMSGLAPALQVGITDKTVKQWQARYNSPVSRWITRQVQTRLASHHVQETHLGDVLGVMVAVQPEVATIKRLPVHIELWGETLRTVIDATGSGRPVDVVLDVHKKQFDSVFNTAMQSVLTQKN